MKDPKALFPFLFASSWLGDLILTILAFFLAFTHDGPLSPLVFLTVAFCLLAGNLLPLLAYWIHTRHRQAELMAESAEATVRVRDALRRSEDVIGRLDEAEGALSKAILVARQVPERIAESFSSVEALVGRLDTLELTSFTESLDGSARSVEGVEKEVKDLGARLEKLQKTLDAVPASLEKLIEAEAANREPASSEEDTVSLGERLDLLYESLESVQDSLDGLLGRMAAGAVAEPAPEATKPDSPKVAKKAAKPTRTEQAVEEDAAKPVQPTGPAQEEMSLEEAGSAETNPDNVPRSMVRLSVHAMVGMRNKVYIRGDEPWLSWDEGEPMNLVGIGEFSWEMDDIKEPIEVAVFLNDETSAEGENIVLKPGKLVRVSPVFPL